MIDGFADSASQRPNRSARTITVDNLLRKTLRVADPHDPQQIANALLARYPEEAERNRREIAGFNFSSGPATSAVSIDAGPSGFELESARDDLERDIQTLTTSSQLKEIQVELKGWGRAVRSAAAQGLAAARLALDANQHDIALSSRRTLYQYARLARYVGALSEGSTIYFRRFAQSCDLLAALILVAIGDGLASSGITRSTMLVRVAASDLQSRRGAVINALRALTGSLENPLGQSEYPRGIVGYNVLIRQLEAGGQSDLRALLEENNLAAAMDQMVDLAGGSSIDSLRELSTTSAILLDRFERLIGYGAAVPLPGGQAPNGYAVGSPESPPLLAFVAALQLFVDAFSRTGSSRLLHVARPPILAYGLYGTADLAPTQRLLKLTIARGRLVDAIDCMAGCACDEDEVAQVVLLDFLLGQVDRAIDLWAVGTDPDGQGDPERRALATAPLAFAATRTQDFGQQPLVDAGSSVGEALQEVYDILAADFIAVPAEHYVDASELNSANIDLVIAALVSELRIAFAGEMQNERVVRNLATGCATRKVFHREWGGHSGSLVRSFLRAVLCRIAGDDVPIDPASVVHMPQTSDASNQSSVFGDAPRFHCSSNF